MDTEGLNVFVAHASDDVRRNIAAELNDRHHVVGSCGTAAELRRAILSDRPDLLITGVMFPDGDGLDVAIELSKIKPLPSVVVTVARSLELVEKAMRDHVMAYLIEPVVKEDLEASIIVAWSRYQQLQELESQVNSLETALEHRKIIERAKGVLMASDSCSEAEAFNTLRTRSQDERRPMVDIARDILERAETNR